MLSTVRMRFGYVGPRVMELSLPKDFASIVEMMSLSASTVSSRPIALVDGVLLLSDEAGM